MIDRYSLPEMKEIWSLESRFKKMLEVEIAVCEAWQKLGKIPAQAVAEIKKKAKINVNDILDHEKITRHDVIAFLTSLEKYVGPNSKYIHLGLTSSDVVDTAFILMTVEANRLIYKKLVQLKDVIKRIAVKNKTVYMMGRTHGVHAEILTFGFKAAIWYQEAQRNIERLEFAEKQIKFGKISGAVGTYTNLDLQVEKIALKKLGLHPEPISSQIIQRDRFAFYIETIAIISAFIEKIAVEIRLLQKTETLEVEEPFSKGQKGSSAMPHKHNPITCEQLTGLSRIIRSHVHPVLEDIVLWHERDISHSSVERIIFPDATMALYYMLEKMIWILHDLKINPDNMLRNIQATKGLIFSQNILIKLIEKGFIRNKAYELIQTIANEAWSGNKNFQEMVYQNKEITKYLSKTDLDKCFDYRFNEKKIVAVINRALK